jgi:hypothetical protein
MYAARVIVTGLAALAVFMTIESCDMANQTPRVVSEYTISDRFNVETIEHKMLVPAANPAIDTCYAVAYVSVQTIDLMEATYAVQLGQDGVFIVDANARSSFFSSGEIARAKAYQDLDRQCEGRDLVFTVKMVFSPTPDNFMEQSL